MTDDVLIIITHGYNSDGEYVEELQKRFQQAGYNAVTYRYGRWFHGPTWLTWLPNVIANRLRTSDVVNGLYNLVQSHWNKRIVLVGHSHGHRVNWEVQRLHSAVVGVIGFNGALNRNTIFRTWVINCFCPTDKVLKVGGRFRPFSKWGDYGARENLGATNINMASFGVKGHSDFLKKLDDIMVPVLKEMKGLLC